MSLRVWLPLNGDLRNNGLSNSIPAFNSSNQSIVDGGKIGKCLKTTNTGNINLNYIPDINTGSISFGGWFKFNKDEIKTILEAKTYTSSATTATGNLIGNDSYGGLGIIWTSNNMYNDNKVFSALNIFCAIRTSTTNQNTSLFSVSFDTWTHIYFVWNIETRVLSFYKNGSLVNSKTFVNFTDARVSSLILNYDAIYGGNGPSACIPFYVNDFRIYDHALSAKEVKELSKGLVAHYKLDNPYISNNLIINGFGELGNEGWANSNISTTEIPSGHSEIKASFYNGNYTDIIAINPNHSYTISGYVKSSGATSGTTYPSIYPYDVDKNFIAFYNAQCGFSATWKTTLAQPLHTGDTVIYATDLSNWSTANNNHYYHVAIFGYKDSNGYIYPDMIYTQDSPSFGSYSDKSNINKTNNTITLKSAYTGKDRPAGTTICQATDGSTYYYPWGGLGLGGLSDWVFKTANFTPKNEARLKACRYIRWNTYANCYIAGNQLIDNNDNSDKICDSSGYGNNSQVWKYDDNGNIQVSLSTPRNSLSTYINSENNKTNTASGTVYIYGNCELTTPNYLTLAFWCKPIAGYGGGTTQGQICLTNTEIGNNAASDYLASPLNHRDGGYDVNGSDGTTHKRLTVDFTANEWHHYVVVYNGRYAINYKDGVQTATVDMGSNMTLYNMKGIVLGFSKAGGVWRSNKSLYSDVRLYATALSADDIKELYNIGASIDKNGNVFAYEFKED